ncbi:MAG: XRE family transcriptional regulator [Elusimicrobiales bacterium]|nr:XRE family transcriptional regulator [Elusimicrobiales bacterium]
MHFEELLKKWNHGILRGAQLRLAEALAISHPTVSGWVAGRNLPSEDLRPKVAKTLGVSIEELNKVFVETKAAKKLHVPDKLKHLTTELTNAVIPAGPIPVLGTVSAENFKLSFEAVPDEYIYAPCPPGHQCFGLKVKRHCMEPKISDGEYIIVAKTGYVDDGQLAVINVGEDCTLKRVYKRDDHVELKPDNPKFKSLKVKPEEMRILGRATGKFSKF